MIILVCTLISNTAGRELLWRSTTLLEARWYEIVITLNLLSLKLEQITEVRAVARLRLWALSGGEILKRLAWHNNSIRDSGGNYGRNFQKFSC
jgi:hypothetical protein